MELLIEILIVDIKPDFTPLFLNNWNNKDAVVVFPFVPVIPIIVSFSEGLLNQFPAIIAFAWEDELTCIYVTFLFMILGIFSTLV